MTSTLVSVNTYVHSVAYVADQMLASIKRIIALSGLDPAKFTDNWAGLESGVRTWMQSRDLLCVTLEVFDPLTNQLVVRWDFEIRYTTAAEDDGVFWADSNAIRNAIEKSGHIPTSCSYGIIVRTKVGSPSVPGWTPTTFRSTDGFQKHNIGTTIGATSLAAGVAYWRKV